MKRIVLYLGGFLAALLDQSLEFMSDRGLTVHGSPKPTLANATVSAAPSGGTRRSHESALPSRAVGLISSLYLDRASARCSLGHLRGRGREVLRATRSA